MTLHNCYMLVEDESSQSTIFNHPREFYWMVSDIMTETRKNSPELRENQPLIGTSVFSGQALFRRVSRERTESEPSTLRKGKWTTEEEDYATKIISLFNRGLLPIPAGTTLRTYLSETLHW